MVAILSRLPDAAWFHHNRGKFAGVVFGMALQLLLAGFIAAMLGGGLSDNPIIQPSPYVLY